MPDDASGIVSKRSSMTLFSDNTCHYSHRVRLVLAEKGVTVELVESENGAISPELSELNPYSSMPTLVDRELVLYESKVMMEVPRRAFPASALAACVSRGARRESFVCLPYRARLGHIGGCYPVFAQ